MPRESLLAAVLLVCAIASAHGTEPADTDRDTAEETSSFWAFRRLAPQPVPECGNRQIPIVGTVRNPIDAFILRDLEKHGLTRRVKKLRRLESSLTISRALRPMACLSQPAAEATDGRKQNVPGLEQEGHGRRRKSASLQGWRMKSTG